MSQPIITPAILINGEIPAGFRAVHLRTSATDQLSKVILPRNPQQGDVVIFTATSMQGIAAVTVSGGEGLDAIEYKIVPPAQNSFTFDDGVWVISGANVSALSHRLVGDRIPDNPKSYTSYQLQNGNFVDEIFLPDQASHGDMIFITSKAGSVATVAPGALLFNSTIKIRKGDLYVFTYLGASGKWGLRHSPTRTPKPTSDLAQPKAPRTRYTIRPANWLPQVRLPQQAGDRDRIIITSTAQRSTRILPANIINPAAMTVSSGEEYEFLYVKEKKGWFMDRYPDTIYKQDEIKNGNVRPLTRPRTFVKLEGESGFPSIITLPKNQPKGSRVIVESRIDKETEVRFRNIRHRITYNDTVSFIVDDKGVWMRETTTIDVLLLYSDKAAIEYGAEAIKAHLLLGMSLTNLALENSGAKFRFRPKAIEEVPALGEYRDAILPTLHNLAKNALAKQYRDIHSADLVYYLGLEGGGTRIDEDGKTQPDCGYAYVLENNDNPENDPEHYGFAVGSANCEASVMRHELGHNMGIYHGSEGSSYNQGYSDLWTIMSDYKGLHYYSTPHRYTPDYGIPMGIPNKIDAVRYMNEGAKRKAATREDE